MLVRRSTEIDDIAAAFEALVVRRIPEQRIVFLDHGHDRLAAGRGVAADDVRNTGIDDEVPADRSILGCFASGISNQRRKFEIEVRRSVDLLDGEQRSIEHRLADRGVGPGRGKQHADRDFHFSAQCSSAQKISPDALEGVRASLPRRTVLILHIFTFKPASRQIQLNRPPYRQKCQILISARTLTALRVVSISICFCSIK